MIRLPLRILSGLLMFVALASIARAGVSGHLHPDELRCEYLSDPLGIGETSPRLTWMLHADRRAETQTAYRVLVATSSEELSKDQGDLWDSGKVQSPQTANIAYDGKPLKSRQRCHWKVMSWDRDGQPGEWSRSATWEMGLLAPSDWLAQWVDASPSPTDIRITSAEYCTLDGKVRKDVGSQITAILRQGKAISVTNEALGGDPAVNIRKHLVIEHELGGVKLRTDTPENGTANIPRARLPYLRKTFDLDKPVAAARLYATALGIHELSLNGRHVGDDHFSPGWTDYRKRIRYQVYDVTSQLRQGRNALGAVVGPGWFCGRAGLFHAREFYGKSPALLAQLEITFADGSILRINSDESWRRHDGPILAADIMDGEFHDARAEIADWCNPELDDHDWSPVKCRSESRNLETSVDAPVRELQKLKAISLTEPKPGRWTFDLGQNMVGVARLRLHQPVGTVVTIRHAEMLNPDGTIYTANLRGAAATDTYICSASDSDWQPSFTFHGFRYVELTGLVERPSIEAVTGIVLGSDLPPAGEFSCSDPRINQLQSNIRWGLRGNYLSVPTDCPQRDERMGWMADAQVFLPAATFEADVASFMTKWMVDVEDAQREDGAYSDVSPVMTGLSYGTPAWADAGAIVPWTIYQMYGDTRILHRHIDSMARWVDWCERNSTDRIRDHARGNDYGDWLNIRAETPKDLLGTAYFAHAADIVARSFDALNRREQAAKYHALHDKIAAAFREKYVDGDGRIAGDTQCGYVLALRFGLLPEPLRGRAAERLVAEIQKRDWHLSTGFVGVGNLLPVLTRAGREDVAYRLLMQDSFPSWLFSVKHGATTIWERWDGWTPEHGPHPDDSMNSFNHYSLGSCGEWLFSGVGGIELDPDHPGFSHFNVRPHMIGPLTSATAKFRSIRGEIRTDWRREGDRLRLDVTVPANTTASVYLPTGNAGMGITESGGSVQKAEGVRSLQAVGKGQLLIEVGSGVYSFTTTRTPDAPVKGTPGAK